MSDRQQSFKIKANSPSLTVESHNKSKGDKDQLQEHLDEIKEDTTKTVVVPQNLSQIVAMMKSEVPF